MGWGYRPYVSVNARRAEAKRKMTALKKQGKEILPVEIEGRKIARTFWGEAWCNHLESFSDYANRLPRGRTYARNGSVCHLEIGGGEVKAIVSGSELYDVKIKINKLPQNIWSNVKERCSGHIGSLLELLKGRFSNAVMSVVTDRNAGLFPRPTEINLDCSCPDWAVMCKHVAAVLYGVGARLDERPELLFLLRGVDHEELIMAKTTATALAGGKRDGLKYVAESDLEDVFGIELFEEVSTDSLRPSTKTKTEPKTKTEQKKRSIDRIQPLSKTPKLLEKSKDKAGLPPTGKAVRDLRASLDITQSQLASLIGMSATTVGSWERKRGRLNLQPRTLSALESVMKMTKRQVLRRLEQ
jgi:uncharacterized Zn finger protein